MRRIGLFLLLHFLHYYIQILRGRVGLSSYPVFYLYRIIGTILASSFTTLFNYLSIDRILYLAIILPLLRSRSLPRISL